MAAPCDHSFCHEDHSDCVNHADCTWFCDPSQDDESDEPGYPDEDAEYVRWKEDNL